jgi:hypothetical protein
VTVRGTPLALALLLALSAGPLASTGAAQERVERERRERREPRDTIPRDSILRDTVIAQPEPPALGYDPAALAFELTVGLPGSGNAQRQPATVWRTDLQGTVLDSARLTRSLAVRGGVVATVAAVIGLGPDWAVRGGLGLATARAQVAYGGPDADSLLVSAANAVPTPGTALMLVALETGVRYRIPSRKRLQPYLELGAAYVSWHARGTASGLQSELGGRFEATAGLGGVIPLNHRFSARIHATTRVFRTPVGPRTAGDTLGSRVVPGWPPTRKDGYRRTIVTAEAPARSPFADGALELLSLVRLQLGLSYDIRPPGKEATPAPDTVEPPGR